MKSKSKNELALAERRFIDITKQVDAIITNILLMSKQMADIYKDGMELKRILKEQLEEDEYA